MIEIDSNAGAARLAGIGRVFGVADEVAGEHRIRPGLECGTGFEIRLGGSSCQAASSGAMQGS
jgi:hypothetical protein